MSKPLIETCLEGVPLVVEAARSSVSGQIIGLRLQTKPQSKTVLVFADQQLWPGFRLGGEFVPDFDEEIIYSPISLVETPG